MAISDEDGHAIFNFVCEGDSQSNIVAAIDTTMRLKKHFSTTRALFYAPRDELMSIEGITDRIVRRFHAVRMLAQKGALPAVAAKSRVPRLEP